MACREIQKDNSATRLKQAAIKQIAMFKHDCLPWVWRPLLYAQLRCALGQNMFSENSTHTYSYLYTVCTDYWQTQAHKQTVEVLSQIHLLS